MPSKRFGTLRQFLSLLVVLSAAAVLVAIGLGCMNICVDRSVSTAEDGVWKQTDTVAVPAGHEQDVFYPIPYGNPPNLTISSSFNECVVVAQFPDHFRVKNPDVFEHDVEWVAKGLRVPPMPVVIPVVTVPAHDLPPAPVPVSGQ
jgi:hypothetical protein